MHLYELYVVVGFFVVMDFVVVGGGQGNGSGLVYALVICRRWTLCTYYMLLKCYIYCCYELLLL
jgi:hypothetical protein